MANQKWCDRCGETFTDTEGPDEDGKGWEWFGDVLCDDCIEPANDELMATEGHEGDYMTACFVGFLGGP